MPGDHVEEALHEMIDGRDDEICVLRGALASIKALCAGDTHPNWDEGFKTTTTRFKIIDIADMALRQN